MKTFGLIGRNISYSFSRTYFQEKFSKEEYENIQYINFDVKDLMNIKEVLQDTNLIGCNVTIPYKEEIIPFLDELDLHAKSIGAVNTISKNKGKLVGSNTDWIGFKESLIPLLTNRSTIKALVLGTGGAAKAIIYALKQLNIPFVQVSRMPNNNQLNYTDIDKEILEKYHLIINCTPIGTFPNIDECPEIPYHFIGKNHICYDLIYNPEKTLFLQKAQQNEAVIINGYQMLVNQAEESWKIWSKLI